MDGSFLQRLKIAVHTALPLPSESILILAGLTLYLATCIFTRHALTWAWALVPGLALAMALESWEIWDHYGPEGLAKASLGELAAILGRHARDVLILNLAPLAVFLSAHAIARLTHD